jgi:hypothetical protein
MMDEVLRPAGSGDVIQWMAFRWIQISLHAVLDSFHEML